MARKVTSTQLAILIDENLSIDNIVKTHVKLVTQPVRELVNAEEIPMMTKNDSFVPQYRIVKEGKPAPREAVLYHKYLFLLHVIITRCTSNKYASATFSHTKLREILGKEHYNDMLDTLSYLNVIIVGNTYKVGKHSRTITLLNFNIGYILNQSKKVVEYKQKFADLIGEEKVEYLKGNDTFVDKYNESLSLLRFTRKKEAEEYLLKKSFKNDESKFYYINKINSFDFDIKKIYSVDSNDRIYHYFTNLPKDLKRFFNIKFQLDISNSHPLLFSFFLIDKYNIYKEIVDILISINILESSHHYDGKQLCKSLIDSGVCVDSLKGIPSDVLKYIYTTAKGVFWDSFMELFGEYERSEIKSNLFREVFYSKRYKTTRGKPFAKIFKTVYPSVWRTIMEIKEEEAENLPNRMMQKESQLFRSILEECYVRNWKVFSVHDAIVVLDDVSNTFTLEELQELMLHVYHENGIFPTIAVERY